MSLAVWRSARSRPCMPPALNSRKPNRGRRRVVSAAWPVRLRRCIVWVGGAFCFAAAAATAAIASDRRPYAAANLADAAACPVCDSTQRSPLCQSDPLAFHPATTLPLRLCLSSTALAEDVRARQTAIHSIPTDDRQSLACSSQAVRLTTARRGPAPRGRRLCVSSRMAVAC